MRQPVPQFPHPVRKFKQGGVKTAEKLLASMDVHGQFAGIPIVVQTVNAVNKTQFARKVMDKTLGVHPDVWMPGCPSSEPNASAGVRTSVAGLRS